ncbi:hypothetical protein HQ520_17595 [bacterium]|nr:hypothetical protein [bacterium]
MPILPLPAQRWLKFFHLLLGGTWLAAGLMLVIMGYFFHPTAGPELYGIDRSMKFIDDWIIIPCALGTLLTGLLYSLFTRWGFFKHRWLTIKWVITVGGILFGTFFLGPWLNSLPPLSETGGLDALDDPVYAGNLRLNITWGLLQVGSLLFALYLSVFKPWGKQRSSACSAD